MTASSRLGLASRRRASLDLGFGRLPLARKLLCLRFEPRENGRRVLDQRGFAGHIACRLRDSALQLAGAVFGAPFFAVQRLAGEHEPLQLAAGFGLGVAQLRQLMRGDGLQLGGLGLRLGFFRDVAEIGFEPCVRPIEARLPPPSG